MKDTSVHFGWHLPAHEQHLQKWMANPKNVGDRMNGRQGYQLKKQRKALSYVKQFRTAVDVGGHVGYHAFNMAHAFARVHAFEPVALHRKCFEANTAGLTNITLHAVALGKAPGSVSMNTEVGSSGNTTVGGKGDIPMITLDSLHLTDVDYMKLDAEGYEENILRGAEETLKKCRPVLMCEQKRSMASDHFGLAHMGAITYLKSLGYVVACEISGDFIMVWQ